MVTPRVLVGAAIHRGEGREGVLLTAVAGGGIDVNTGSRFFIRVEPRAYVHPAGTGALFLVLVGGGVRF